MRVGELVVIRIKEGISVGRLLTLPSASNQGDQNSETFRISLGRNREAKLSGERIILGTGIILSDEREVEEFRRRCEDLVESIDLAEIWEMLEEKNAPMSLGDLSELYWGGSYDVVQKMALLVHLESTTTYFSGAEEGYTPQSAQVIKETKSRLRMEEEKKKETVTLMEHLTRAMLPPHISKYQSGLLEHLRGYAIHGDNYTKRIIARNLLDMVKRGQGEPQRFAFELLISVGFLSQDEPIELAQAQLDTDFSSGVMREISDIKLPQVLKQLHRKDLTHVTTFTIDEVGTEDMDDAISLEIETGSMDGGSDASSNNPGSTTYHIGVHVADSGALISPNSLLDQEASRRMATLYLPERKLHMLPQEVSTQLGSLLPGELRVALSLLVSVNDNGDILNWEIVPSVIRSQVALSYEEADQAIINSDHPLHYTLSTLSRIAQSLRKKREDAGAILVERPEMVIKVMTDGVLDVKVTSRSTQARQMVTELMIFANSLHGTICHTQRIPAVYRSQKMPDLSDVLGETNKGALRWYRVMRKLPPANLSTVPGPHEGLGLPVYLQATSPLRRYTDLVMQRQISHFLAGGGTLYSSAIMESVAQRAAIQLRELAKLEEERSRYWFLKYLAQRSLSDSGDVSERRCYQAIVLDKKPGRAGLLELIDYPFRFRAELPGDCTAGDTVTLILHGVDLWRRVALFIHQPSGLS